MKAIKGILLVYTLFYALPIVPVRPRVAAIAVSAVAALSAENVRRSYNKRTALCNQTYSYGLGMVGIEDKEEVKKMEKTINSYYQAERRRDRRFYVGSAVAMGVGATGLAAAVMRKSLPKQRIVRAFDLSPSVANPFGRK